ncbi:hypothetical protein [Cryobacterium sp. 10C3]|uniref:hypothetical protein n=1 Tax=Cryobacterium sp. 10C3 TaxID=3048577 RepID=UPI002AB3FD58|nr:hypothetical protein [Cryobacterium sp. 10C3]MDY7556516.1 hypothetical protein [Cryobacterium sp. 10C3]
MRALTILSVLPELLDTNGDAANARVLAQRARWAGFDATIVPVRSLEELPSKVDAIVIGSGNDSDLLATRDLLAPWSMLCARGQRRAFPCSRSEPAGNS